MMGILDEICIFLGAYLIGALPTGFIIARLYGIKDITQHGSGNIGATNVSRILGTPYFFVVLLLDAAKAFIYIFMLQRYEISMRVQIISAIFLLIGNGVSLFLKGRGGKGISTSLGIMCIFKPMMLPFICFSWLVVLFITRTVGIASIAGLVLLPISMLFLEGIQHPLFLLSMFISVWGVMKHSQNLKTFLLIKSTGRSNTL